MTLRPFLAICRDGIRESRDKRSLVVLLGLGLLCVLFCAGVSFEVRTLAESLDANAKQIGTFRSRTPGLGHFQSSMQADFETSAARNVSPEDGLPPEFASGAIVEFRLAEIHSLDALHTSWKWFDHRRKTGEDLEAPATPPPYTDADREAFLVARFRDFGYSPVTARRLPGDEPAYRVAVAAERLDEVEGASVMSFLFGAFEMPLVESSLATTLAGIETTLVSTLVGFIGMLILLSSFAGFVPDMMQKGTIDLVLARPVGRVRLLLSKYFAALLSVLVLTSLITAGCALGLFAGTGRFNPWVALSSVFATAVFAVLHAASVLVGVLTRSGNVAALVATGVWGISALVGQFHHMSKTIFEDSPLVREGLETAYTVLPKVADVGTLNELLVSRVHFGADAFDRLYGFAFPDIDWALSAGTTAAFLVACLALAAWRFRSRDF